MNDSDIQGTPHIGQKLRAARREQHLSLRELAERAEVSASLLSKIENGKANPSVRSLHSIAEALAVPVHHLFPNDLQTNTETRTTEETSEGTQSEMTASELRAATTDGTIDGAELGFNEGNQQVKGPVVRVGARPTIELLGGVIWSRLTPGEEEGVEFLQICYEASSSSGERMSHHAGREFHYVLEGEMLLELGFERYLLEAGDSIVFDSTTPHRLSNAGTVTMRAITVVFDRI